MQPKNTVMIMRDSPEAATYCTGLSGWVSRNGKYYGCDSTAEEMARYDGCTHVSCSHCGKPCLKTYTACAECRNRLDQERFEARPKQAWDGAAMLYSSTNDTFYISPGDAEDALEKDQTLNSLNLIICEPEFAKIDLDYFIDIIVEDDDPPQQLLDAVKAFNSAMSYTPLSWSPGKFALFIESDNKDNDWDDVDSYGPSA